YRRGIALIDEAVRGFQSLGMSWLDFHGGNWGVLPNGRIVVIDLGLSKPLERPPVERVAERGVVPMLGEGLRVRDDRSVIREAQELFGGRHVVGLRHWPDGTLRLALLDYHRPPSIGRGSTAEEALEDAKARDGRFYRFFIVFEDSPAGRRAMEKVGRSLATF